MDLNLYNKIKAYKAQNILPDISKFSKLKFQKHYNLDWTVTNDKLYFQNKIVISEQNVQSILIELYKDSNITSNDIHSFFNIVYSKYSGIIFQ
jgi:hypothetical protein